MCLFEGFNQEVGSLELRIGFEKRFFRGRFARPGIGLGRGEQKTGGARITWRKTGRATSVT